jgi:hypothetical protein
VNDGADKDYVTTRTEAEVLAEDRLEPLVWHLKGRVEARIVSEWFPGKTITLELNDSEQVVAERVKHMYEVAGWTVDVGAPRKDSKIVRMTLK